MTHAITVLKRYPVLISYWQEDREAFKILDLIECKLSDFHKMGIKIIFSKALPPDFSGVSHLG